MRRPRQRPNLAGALALTLAVIATARPAHADLGHDVEAVTLAWSAFGKVTRLKPRLLERGDVLPLVLPVGPLDPTTPTCATVAVLGTSSLQFSLDPGVRVRQKARDFPEGSLAGALAVTRCGEQKPELAAMSLEMRSPRGVLEFLLLTSDAEPPALTSVLPQRDPGPLAEPPSSGPRPVVAPLAVRVRALEARAAREQALELTTLELSAGSLGAGTTLLTLPPGCHRFDLLGEEAERRATDVDLEIVKADGNETLAADHGESSDGGALVCVSVPTTVTVRFGGVAPFAKLALVRARWELDGSLPARWPGEARSRMSGLLRAERRSLAGAALVDEALGVQGDTLTTLPVEPGACYLALAVGLRGNLVALSVATATARTTAQSRLDPDVAGAALAFCAGADDRVLMEVDARGLGLVWMSTVWQLGRVRLGEVAP